MTYNHINQAITSELISIAGEKNVLLDPSRIEAFSHDETSKEEYGHMPDVVVTPQSTEAVAEIVRLANRVHVPVTPRGGREPDFRAVPSPSMAVSSCRSKR